MIASAILDHPLHHSITIDMKAQSHPLKEKLKVGAPKYKLDAGPSGERCGSMREAMANKNRRFASQET